MERLIAGDTRKPTRFLTYPVTAEVPSPWAPKGHVWPVTSEAIEGGRLRIGFSKISPREAGFR